MLLRMFESFLPLLVMSTASPTKYGLKSDWSLASATALCFYSRTKPSSKRVHTLPAARSHHNE